MLRQILRKIPRKSSKPESSDSAGPESGNGSTNWDNGTPCTNSGKSFSCRLNVVKRVSSAVFPSSVMAGVEAVDPHLSFKDASNVQKQNLFISKLNFCCEVSDDPDNSVAQKDLEHEILIELVDFVSSGAAKFTDPVMAAMCKLCATNLFRVFPPKYRATNASAEMELEEPIFYPDWSHLQCVYDLVLRFVSSADPKAAKKYVDHAFIMRLLDLFDSEDPRERDCLKTILHRIYGKFMVHRPYIRKAVSNIIYNFVFETEHHNGITELLEIFGSVISGFALPLKEEHKIFLLRTLIPLHKPKSMGIYHQQLTYCVVQFIDKDPKLVTTVIKGLLKYWPVTNSQKELMFISELEEILEMTSMDEFQKIMVPLFRRMRCCLNSSHYQVAERAHLLWNNEHILNHIIHNRQVIVPLVFSALEHTQNHWNQAVLNLTWNIRKMICEMDEELVLACQRKLEEEDSKSSVKAEKQRLTWERLESAAGFKPAATNFLARVNPATCSVSC